MNIRTLLGSDALAEEPHREIKMEMVKIINIITVGMALLALVPKMESQIGPPRTPRPLCASQYALANYACGRLPFSPGPPPSPPSHDDQGRGHSHGHRNGHGHGRGHRHRQATPQEDNCCRWVKEVDSQCVCEVLLHLPTFLTRPLHQYTVTIGDSCNATYYCGGPLWFLSLQLKRYAEESDLVWCLLLCGHFWRCGLFDYYLLLNYKVGNKSELNWTLK